MDALEPAPPRAGTAFIAIAASAGGLAALTELLAGLPADLAAAVVIVQHRVPAKDTHLQYLLSRPAHLPIATASDGLLIQSRTVYVASSENHLTVTEDGRFSHEDGLRVHGLHSAANPLFQSAARVFRERAIAVVLTGSGSDGSDGVREISRMGGVVIAQDPTTAEYSGMPQSAIDTGVVDYVLPLFSIAPALVQIVCGDVSRQSLKPPTRSAREQQIGPAEQHLRSRPAAQTPIIGRLDRQRGPGDNHSSLSARRRNSSGTERPARDADP